MVGSTIVTVFMLVSDRYTTICLYNANANMKEGCLVDLLVSETKIKQEASIYYTFFSCQKKRAYIILVRDGKF